MTVNISGQVPGEQQNGLVDIEAELTHERTPDPITAVAIIERASLKFNDVKQEWSATIRLRHVEPLTGADADEGRALLERAYSRRTGNETLPITLDGTEEPAADLEEPELDLDTPLAEKDAGDVDEPELPEAAS